MCSMADHEVSNPSALEIYGLLATLSILSEPDTGLMIQWIEACSLTGELASSGDGGHGCMRVLEGLGSFKRLLEGSSGRKKVRCVQERDR